jgi:hypothetical protein
MPRELRKGDCCEVLVDDLGRWVCGVVWNVWRGVTLEDGKRFTEYDVDLQIDGTDWHGVFTPDHVRLPGRAKHTHVLRANKVKRVN